MFVSSKCILIQECLDIYARKQDKNTKKTFFFAVKEMINIFMHVNTCQYLKKKHTVFIYT